MKKSESMGCWYLIVLFFALFTLISIGVSLDSHKLYTAGACGVLFLFLGLLGWDARRGLAAAQKEEKEEAEKQARSVYVSKAKLAELQRLAEERSNQG